MSNNHLLVRAMGQSNEELNIFFNNNVVAVGWSRSDFTAFANDSDLVNDVVTKYYSKGIVAPQVLGKWKNEIRRFKNMKEGDSIIVPCGSAVCLAKAKSVEIYSKDVEHYKRDLVNQRQVTFFRDKNDNLIKIPRHQLSEGLQRRIRVRGTTIANLSDFQAEIDNLFSLKNFNQVYSEQREREAENFKAKLLDNIQSGKTNLNAGGYGLEKLTQELLSIEGYDAKIQSKARFSGFADADIEAVKEDIFSTAKLLIQIKHHSGHTGTWGAKQLLEVLSSEPDYFSEHQLVLVTSAQPSTELIKICKDKDIQLIGGNELVDWLFNSLDKLKFETKKRLNITDVPVLL